MKRCAATVGILKAPNGGKKKFGCNELLFSLILSLFLVFVFVLIERLLLQGMKGLVS